MKFSPESLVIGGEQIGLNDWGNLQLEDLYDAIDFLVAHGVNEIDTSGVYGLGSSEQNISLYEQSSAVSLRVSTKVGLSVERSDVDLVGRKTIRKDGSKFGIYSNFIDSVARLQRVPLYQVFLHYEDPSVELEQSIRTLKYLKDVGLISNIGLANCDVRLLHSSVLDMLDSIQIELNLVRYIEDRTSLNEQIKLAQSKDLKIYTYSPLNRGMLTENFLEKITLLAADKLDRRSVLWSASDFKKSIKIWHQISELSQRMEIPINILSLLFLQEYLGLNKIILGFKRKSQLAQIFDEFAITSQEFRIQIDNFLDNVNY